MTPENLTNEKEITVKTADKNAVVTTRARSRKIKNGMFDTPEIVAVSLSALALLGVVFAYFFLLLPAREDDKRRKADFAQMQTQLADLQTKSAETKTKADGTVDLVSSVDRFEATFMPPAATGNAALYQRLNELIRANGLRNTAGPEYAPLEIVAPGTKSTTKQQSIFPGTSVNVTVEGNYANLRRFVSELENTRQFLIINAVEIESNGTGSTTSSGGSTPTQPAPVNPTQPNTINPRAGETGAAKQPPATSGAANPSRRGAVSMRLELAAYFRRNAPQTNQPN